MTRGDDCRLMPKRNRAVSEQPSGSRPGSVRKMQRLVLEPGDKLALGTIFLGEGSHLGWGALLSGIVGQCINKSVIAFRCYW